ncbi:hypothetical protein YC2023_009419 [Brassica napus]
MIFLNIHFQRVLMFKLITAWTTLELDLSMVSLKTWDGLSIQRFRWRSLRRRVSRLERLYNSGVGDITCVAPSGKALSDASRWNQNGLNLRRER